MHTDEDYQNDAYPAVISDLGELLSRALRSPSIGEGDETHILQQFRRSILQQLRRKDPHSIDLFLQHKLDS